MALSLNDIKNKPSIRVEQKQRPQKKMVMPWQDMKSGVEQTTGEKTELKLRQSEDKVETKARVKSGQTEDKVKTNLGQTEDKKKSGDEKLRTELRTPHRTKLGQTEDKVRTMKPVFSSCVGVQRSLLLFFYESCKAAGSRQTNQISVEHICDACKLTPHTARKSIQRLESKHLLRRIDFKNGRGGWSRYELPDQVFQDILRDETEDKFRTKLGQTEDKVETELRTELRTTLPSSSSMINNNLIPTTTSSNVRASIHIWTLEDLDYSMLSDIGFGRSQVLQLHSLGIPFDVLQRSLVHFDFELRHTPSGKSIKEPLALLMKRLRQNGCWEAPEEYQKRIEHFQTRFKEREQQVSESVAEEDIGIVISKTEIYGSSSVEVEQN